MPENKNKKNPNVIPNASSSGKKSPNVPNLRFGEFAKKNWTCKKVKNILTIKNGKDQKTIEKKHGKYNIYGTGGIIGQTDSFLYDKPSVCIGRKGTINKPIYLDEPFWTVDTLFYTDIYNANALFVFYLFQTINWNFYNQSSGRPSLTSSVIENINIRIPEKLEQQKIADFLTLIDKRIETQSKIIEDLELFKNLVSEFLFNITPSKFSELENFLSKGKAGGTPSSTNKQFYDGEIPFLSISDMTRQGKFITKTEKTISQLGLENSSAWLVPCNSLIFSMYASVGQVAINKIPLTTSQAIFSMVLKNNELLEYLYYFLCYFKSYKLRKFLETGTQSNINADMVKKIKIPDYGGFNKKIARILSIFDKKIQKEKDMLKLYKKQKAYLLQNMFI